MRTFLGLFMMMIVSGDNEVRINGFLKDSVLLPCNCSGRNLSRVVKWQMEGLNGLSRVLELDVGNTSDSFDRYKGRAKIFVANCSLLLTNITAEDQGKYTCRFYVQELYMYSVRKLNISAKYNVCQQPARNLDGGVRVMVFQCDATGRYGEAEIQWYLDGELLSNSSKTNITHTSPVGTPTGHYKFKSTLFTQFKWTAEPICGMKVKGIPSHIEYVCEEGTGYFTSQQQKCSMRYFKIIPIVLVLGLSLVLWCRWN